MGSGRDWSPFFFYIKTFFSDTKKSVRKLVSEVAFGFYIRGLQYFIRYSKRFPLFQVMVKYATQCYLMSVDIKAIFAITLICKKFKIT